MKYAFLLLFAFAGNQLNDSLPFRNTAAETSLERLSRKLQSLRQIRYKITRELNYASEHYLNKSGWQVYIDFQTTDTVAGFRYQFEDAATLQIFNGTEKFDIDRKAKSLQINDRPGQAAFNNLSALYNSILTLKNVLPLLIADKHLAKTTGDTSLGGMPCELVTLNLGKRRIQNLGKGWDAMQTTSDFIYRIIIDGKTGMPVEILQGNNLNNDFIKTTFSDIDTSAGMPAELSWYYSSYTNDYKPVVPAKTEMVRAGMPAPGWELTRYDKNERVSLAGLKGKVVLLDFWIKNCGPCIQSVPHLNALQEKFKDWNFALVSINSYDSQKEIDWFCSKHKTKYTVLTNGKQVAESYGVTGFPSIFIIDKNGKITYVNPGYGDKTEAELETVIQKALQ